jgi:hypothetical protein
MDKLSQVGVTRNAQLEHADITNAQHLFGDPAVEPLAAFQLISGDAEEEGDSLYGDAHKGKKHGNSAVLAKRARVNKELTVAANRQSIRKAHDVTHNMPKINKNSLLRFFALKGAKMNSSPIEPQSSFVMDTWKVMLDQQNIQTPFLQETAIGTFVAGVWTAQATGVATSRLFTALILQFGTNILNAAPGTVISISATIPTTGGLLTIAATPFLFTYEKGYDVRFLMFPWVLVSNKPMPVLGSYNNANPITFTVTGLPAASSVNLIVPGSLHPWVVAMRNGLI